jgi:hypothetical protein
MKCPYNKKSIKYVKDYTNELIDEETGVLKGYKEAYYEEYELMDCLKEECGVWQCSRCNYTKE